MLARALSEELKDIGKQFDVTPFVIADRKYVIAHPAMASQELLKKAVADEQLPTIDSIGDPVLAGMWSHTGPLDTSVPLREATGHWAGVGGSYYTFIYRKLALPGQADMIAGFYLPSSATRQDRWLSAAVTGVGLALMLLAIIGATRLARGLARPMTDFGAASRAIGEFDFSEHGLEEWEHSRVEEVAETAAAMRRTAHALTAFERYVPKSLVRQLLLLGSDSSRPVRRDMSIMFLDLQGYTRFAKDRPADEVALYLDTIFSKIGPIIEKNSGTIDKYTGDGLMAFWGAPVPDKDHAEHAVDAALEIARELTPFIQAQRAINAENCRIRIGIHSGEAVVGDVGYGGRINYTVVGDTVNMAKRTEGAGRIVPLDVAVVVVVTPAVLERTAMAGVPRSALEGGEPLGQLWLLGDAARAAGTSPAIAEPVRQA
jgi:class 3 adenylate cyclase